MLTMRLIWIWNQSPPPRPPWGRAGSSATSKDHTIHVNFTSFRERDAAKQAMIAAFLAKMDKGGGGGTIIHVCHRRPLPPRSRSTPNPPSRNKEPGKKHIIVYLVPVNWNPATGSTGAHGGALPIKSRINDTVWVFLHKDAPRHTWCIDIHYEPTGQSSTNLLCTKVCHCLC